MVLFIVLLNDAELTLLPPNPATLTIRPFVNRPVVTNSIHGAELPIPQGILGALADGPIPPHRLVLVLATPGTESRLLAAIFRPLQLVNAVEVTDPIRLTLPLKLLRLMLTQFPSIVPPTAKGTQTPDGPLVPRIIRLKLSPPVMCPMALLVTSRQVMSRSPNLLMGPL